MRSILPGMKPIVLTAVLALGSAGPQAACAEIYGTGKTITATVSSVVQTLDHTYVECSYRFNTRWLRDQRLDKIEVGDTIRFNDNAPLLNVQFREINMSFGSITFTDIRVVEEPRVVEEYRGVEQDGTLVFTDNPARIRNRKGKK